MSGEAAVKAPPSDARATGVLGGALVKANVMLDPLVLHTGVICRSWLFGPGALAHL